MTKFENFIKIQVVPTLPQVLPSWGKQSDNTGEKEMSKSKHTPGPWLLCEYEDGGVQVADVIDENGRCIADCLPINVARLVSAAPLLLKELHKLLELGIFPSRYCEDRVAVAIVKALGRELPP